MKLVDDLKIRMEKKEKYYEESFQRADQQRNELRHDIDTKTWERIESQKKFEIFMMGRMDQVGKEVNSIKKSDIPALGLE